METDECPWGRYAVLADELVFVASKASTRTTHAAFDWLLGTTAPVGSDEEKPSATAQRRNVSWPMPQTEVGDPDDLGREAHVEDLGTGDRVGRGA